MVGKVCGLVISPCCIRRRAPPSRSIAILNDGSKPGLRRVTARVLSMPPSRHTRLQLVPRRGLKADAPVGGPYGRGRALPRHRARGLIRAHARPLPLRVPADADRQKTALSGHSASDPTQSPGPPRTLPRSSRPTIVQRLRLGVESGGKACSSRHSTGEVE